MMELAVACESAGWDGIFLWDHLDYPAPVEAVLDPYVCLGAIASVTTRIQIGPLVTPLTRRRPEAGVGEVVKRGRGHFDHGPEGLAGSGCHVATAIRGSFSHALRRRSRPSVVGTITVTALR